MISATIHTAEGDEVLTVAEYGQDILERAKLKADMHNQGEEAKFKEDPAYKPDLWSVTQDDEATP
jgi:hypothetical protein